MRITRCATSGGSRLALIDRDEAIDVAGVLQYQLETRDGMARGTAGRLAAALVPPTLGDFLALAARGHDEVGAVAASLVAADPQERAELVAAGLIVPLEQVRFEPLLAPGSTLYCIGFNYAAHVAEGTGAIPEVPGIFIRTVGSLVGHLEPLRRPIGVSVQFDYEVELAVVIGRACHRIGREEALDYVAGYSILNDGSVRDFQIAATIPTAGKNFVASGSLGPWLVTGDEISDPNALALCTRLNGETVQESNTSEMIFDVPAIVAHLSQFAVLQPGDVIGTGTPAGVGFRRKPPRYLEPGETVSFEIEEIGTLTNPICDETAPPRAVALSGLRA